MGGCLDSASCLVDAGYPGIMLECNEDPETVRALCLGSKTDSGGGGVAGLLSELVPSVFFRFPQGVLKGGLKEWSFSWWLQNDRIWPKSFGASTQSGEMSRCLAASGWGLVLVAAGGGFCGERKLINKKSWVKHDSKKETLQSIMKAQSFPRWIILSVNTSTRTTKTSKQHKKALNMTKHTHTHKRNSTNHKQAAKSLNKHQQDLTKPLKSKGKQRTHTHIHKTITNIY